MALPNLVARATDAVAATNGLQPNSSAFSKSAPAPSAAPRLARSCLAASSSAGKRTTQGPCEVPYQRRLCQTVYIRPTFQNSAPQVRAQAMRTGRSHSSRLTPNATAYAPPSGSAAATPATPPEFASAERLLDWVSNYRDQPQFWRVPAAVHAMRDHRLFSDEEQRWFCIGFIAGVLGTNPNDGPGLIPKMFPMPPKEQEVIIRAIAYSGRPDWQDLLVKNAAKMPLRKPLIDDLLNGRRPTLQATELDTGGTTAVYALWGYYVASGQHEPVMRIMHALQWSKGAQEAGFSSARSPRAGARMPTTSRRSRRAGPRNGRSPLMRSAIAS